jgi:myo-inositol 2-dehydrogenase/D-chiro-inositol 1-dehydrogenase
MHIGAFRGAGADVVALCGRDLAKTRAIAAAEGVSMATDSVFELCAAVDVVVVASTDRLHLDHVRAAIERGRGVLCEKPLCLNLDQARAMVRLAASARAPCAVSFPYRQLAPLRALRRALQERTPLRELDVVVRNAFLRPRPFATSGGDPSGDLGGASHVVDAAL